MLFGVTHEKILVKRKKYALLTSEGRGNFFGYARRMCSRPAAVTQHAVWRIHTHECCYAVLLLLRILLSKLICEISSRRRLDKRGDVRRVSFARTWTQRQLNLTEMGNDYTYTGFPRNVRYRYIHNKQTHEQVEPTAIKEQTFPPILHAYKLGRFVAMHSFSCTRKAKKKQAKNNLWFCQSSLRNEFRSFRRREKKKRNLKRRDDIQSPALKEEEKKFLFFSSSNCLMVVSNGGGEKMKNKKLFFGWEKEGEKT